jgi:hypothetical protein
MNAGTRSAGAGVECAACAPAATGVAWARASGRGAGCVGVGVLLAESPPAPPHAGETIDAAKTATTSTLVLIPLDMIESPLV